MSKSLQLRSLDIEKYTKFVCDRQPSVQELQTIFESYIKNFHSTHIALSIPLDSNEGFLKRTYIPSPLTIDSFTDTCIEIVHNLGVNVYFKGTFCGVENLYDFGYDKTTPIGTIDDSREDTWMGKISQWLDIHAKNIRKEDIFGIIPDITSHVSGNNSFLSNIYENENVNLQANFLTFYTELAKLYESKGIKLGNYSSNLYKDIISGWIPSFIFDLTGIMSITYSNNGESPQELERIFNELYLQFHQPIFLNGWSLPKESLITTNIDLKAQEYFNVFARLRDKGILIGMDYFDGLNFDEGVLTDNNLNEEGKLLKEFYAQNVIEQIGIKPKEIDQIVTKPIGDAKKEVKIPKKKRGRKKKSTHPEAPKPTPQPPISIEHPVVSKIHKYKRVNYFLFLEMLSYMVGGLILTVVTVSFMGIKFDVTILIMQIIYTLLVIILYKLTTM